MNTLFATEVEVMLESAPSDEALADLRVRAVMTREKAFSYLATGGRRRPFLVVTPHGRDDALCLSEHLDILGVTVVERESIADWPVAATPLYLRRFDRRALVQAAVYEEAWRRVFDGDVTAERWDLRDEADLVRLALAKEKLRDACPTLHLRMALPEETLAIGLHAFHSPDLERWALESACLSV